MDPLSALYLPVLFGAPWIIFGVILVVRGYRRTLGSLRWREVRALRTAPRCDIASARPVLAKFVGRVGGGDAVPSVVHHVPCVYQSVAYFTIARDFRGRQTKVLDRIEAHTPIFWVDDGTGKLEIDPAHVHIDAMSEATDADEMAFESRFRVGETVAVVGTVISGSRAGAYRTNAADVPVARFAEPPLVTYRTEPELVPSLAPAMLGVLFILLGTGILGFIGVQLHARMARDAGVQVAQ